MRRAARTAEMFGQQQQFYAPRGIVSYAPTMQYASRTQQQYQDPRTAGDFYSPYAERPARTAVGWEEWSPLYTDKRHIQQSMMANVGTGAVAGAALGGAMMGYNWMAGDS